MSNYFYSDVGFSRRYSCVSGKLVACFILTHVLLTHKQCNSLPSHLHPALGIRDYAAAGLFVGSFLFEVIADRQKTAWRRAKDAKEHDEKFITSGLWSISRHPK